MMITITEEVLMHILVLVRDIIKHRTLYMRAQELSKHVS